MKFPYLTYQNHHLFLENLSLHSLIKQHGTPLYVYSKQAIIDSIKQIQNAFADIPHHIHYAVKANSNTAILNLLAQHGVGFDLVSQGELMRVLHAGSTANQAVFSGVGKSTKEIEFALTQNIFCFNVESMEELDRIHSVARTLNKKAPIALRINPDIDPKTHPYITTAIETSKFGIPYTQAIDCYAVASQLSHIEIKGISFHLGSQISEIKPFSDAIMVMLKLIDQLFENNIRFQYFDIGGGYGITYSEENYFDLTSYAVELKKLLKQRELTLLLEPGRFLVGNAGYLITQVEYLKKTPYRHFAIVDAAMNDLIRPALYEAWHDIIPLNIHSDLKPECYDVVGPVCESGDFLGLNRTLAIKPNDYLAVCSAGAYGFSMSSNYNSRRQPAEVLVDDDRHTLIRSRQSYEQLLLNESIQRNT